MKLRKLGVLLLMMLIAVLVASCQSGGDSGDSGDNGGDDTAAQGVELSETYTDTVEGIGEISLKYPAGWNVEGGFGSIIVSNVESTESMQTLESGQAAVIVTILPGEQVAAMSAAGEMSLSDLLGLMTTQMATEGAEPFSEVEEFEVNGLSAASVSGKQTLGGEELVEATVIIIDTGDGYAMAVGMAHDGELADNVDTFRAIAGSITIQAPEATESAG